MAHTTPEYQDFLEGLTKDLPKQPVVAEVKPKVNGLLFENLEKLGMLQDFQEVGFNRYVFIPVTKQAEKYNWDAGSVWQVKEIEGKKYLCREDDPAVTIAKKLAAKIPTEEVSQVESSLSGEVWEIPTSVLQETIRGIEEKKTERDLSVEEESELNKLTEELDLRGTKASKTAAKFYCKTEDKVLNNNEEASKHREKGCEVTSVGESELGLEGVQPAGQKLSEEFEVPPAVGNLKDGDKVETETGQVGVIHTSEEPSFGDEVFWDITYEDGSQDTISEKFLQRV